MKSDIGVLIGKAREDAKLTQDQFGKKYNISGPAVFKFEKGYVRPSLELWLLMARDIDITEAQAVLLWARAKLPPKYQNLIDVETPAAVKEANRKVGRAKKTAKANSPEEMRKNILEDPNAPSGLKRLLNDNDLWALYKPQVHEIELLLNTFTPMGHGSKSSYREALRLVREFTGS